MEINRNFGNCEKSPYIVCSARVVVPWHSTGMDLWNRNLLLMQLFYVFASSVRQNVDTSTLMLVF